MKQTSKHRIEPNYKAWLRHKPIHVLMRLIGGVVMVGIATTILIGMIRKEDMEISLISIVFVVGASLYAFPRMIFNRYEADSNYRWNNMNADFELKDGKSEEQK